ncbi:MAG TPA: tetratricopeptide repeat protein [Candidatus Wunengus sp. YC61]|uniref:tetratricopeptide repeat protein n=1 Tax=Candidatus Wunengus sp. YC61 TaxID=3367698 RepID=UPI0040282DAE
MINVMNKKSFKTVPINNNDIFNDSDITVTLANTLIEKGSWDEAYPQLKAAVEINPNYAQGYNHLGIYYIKNKKYTEAINNFKKALQIDFDLTEAHYNLASLYMEHKEYTMALSHFKEVVLAKPDDYETYYFMGLCHIHLGLEKEAEAFFSESFSLKPDYIPPAINLCKLLIKKDAYTKAKNILLRVLKTDTSLPEVHFLLGIIYKMQKMYPRAMKHLRETLLIDKNNTEAYNLLGECCIELGMDKQAEPLFAMAVKLDISYISAICNLGKLYYDQKKYHDAICFMEKSLDTYEAIHSINSILSETTHTDEIAPLYNLLGHCYKMTGNPIRARTIWNKSLAIDPQQRDIIAALESLPQPSRVHKRVSLVID